MDKIEKKYGIAGAAKLASNKNTLRRSKFSPSPTDYVHGSSLSALWRNIRALKEIVVKLAE